MVKRTDNRLQVQWIMRFTTATKVIEALEEMVVSFPLESALLHCIWKHIEESIFTNLNVYP